MQPCKLLIGQTNKIDQLLCVMQWRLFADCINNVGMPLAAHLALLICYFGALSPLSRWSSRTLTGDVSQYDVPSGYVADLMSPLFPDAFLLLACLGSLARAITGMHTCCSHSHMGPAEHRRSEGGSLR